MVDNKFRTIGPQSKPIKQPESDVELDTAFSEFDRRTQRAHLLFNIDWFPSSYAEKTDYMRRYRNQMFMRDNQSSTEVQLLRIVRVQLKGDQFENEKGEIVSGVRSAVVYTLYSNVYEKEAYKMGSKVYMEIEDKIPQVGSFATYKVGMYRYPHCVPVLDKSVYPPKPIKNEIANYSWRFWVEDSPAVINSLIKKWGEPVKGFFCAIVNSSATSLESPFESHITYRINSKDDFLNCSVSELIAMNTEGFLKKGDDSSKVEKYRKFLARKKQLEKEGVSTVMPLDADNAAFLQQHNIDINNLVSQLKLNTIVNNNNEPPIPAAKTKTKRSK